MSGHVCGVADSKTVDALNKAYTKIKKRLENLGIITTGLSKAEIISILTDLMTKHNYSQDAVMKLLVEKNKRLLCDAISSFKEKKLQEDKIVGVYKIGNATIVVEQGKKWTKNTPGKNPKTLYIYSENLQASNVIFGEEIGETIKVKQGVKLNVSGTSALIRTNDNGEVRKNVIGIVTKKNAQNEDGNFINESGFFEDTNEDFEAFTKANTRSITKIKELLLAADSSYTQIEFPKGFALDKARLPKRFAEWLQKTLFEELGINTQIEPFQNGYGLLINPPSKRETKQSKEVQDAIKKVAEIAEAKAKDIAESMSAVRPKLDPILVDPNDMSLLAQVFPDIEQRMARVSFISEQFSTTLTAIINTLRKDLGSKEDRSEEEEEYYRGITGKEEVDHRLYALKNFKSNGEPLAIYILNDIRKNLLDVVALGESEGGVDKIATSVLLNGDGILGKTFREELRDRGLDIGSREALSMAKRRARHLVNEYKKMCNEDVYNALCAEAAYEIQFLENIEFDFQNVPVETRDDENEDNDEGIKENANKEGYMIKYKLIDPATTLSIKMKTLLGSIYKRDYRDNSKYVYNDLGGRVRMDAFVAYNILLEEFHSMKNTDSFPVVLERAIRRYPWLRDIQDVLVYNPLNSKAFDLRAKKQFYTIMRKAQVPYGMVSANGLIQKLNRDMSSSAIYENIAKNYYGRVVLGPKSIYTATGEADIDNCMAIDKLFSFHPTVEALEGESRAEKKERKRISLYKYQPLGWAKRVLYQALKGQDLEEAVVSDVKLAIAILAGYDRKNVRLEDILRNIGVDTEKLDIDSLFGDFLSLEDEELEEITSTSQLLEHISRDQVSRLYRLLTAIETIVSQSDRTGYKRFQKGDDLVTKFQQAYLMIGSALNLATEGYTGLTFRHNGSTHSSYAAPDFISDLVDIISNTENEEEATRWIENKYGQYEFYKNQKTGKWKNKLLELFMTKVGDSYPYRKSFQYINMLSLMGSDEENSISEIEPEQLITGLVHAYFCANNDGDRRQFGYFRSPLFSDVDALVLFKLPRDGQPGYQERILENLVQLARQELNRIINIKTDKGKVKVEFYNDGKKNNGAKFQYLPGLNKYLDKIIEEWTTVAQEEGPIEHLEKVDNLLRGFIKEILEKEKAKFFSQFSKDSKRRIYDRLSKGAVIDPNAEESENPLGLITKEDDNKKTEKELDDAQIKEVDEKLEEFFYNDFYTHSQIQQLLGGDLALYKNYIDYIKRNKQAYACGDRLYDKQTDEQGNTIGDLIERVIYLEDEDIITNTFESLKDLLEDPSLSDVDRSIMRFAIETYKKKTTSTDGQSLRSIHSFKKIIDARGLWTDDMERAYNNIVHNHKIDAKDFLALWNSIKPFYYGETSVMINGENTKINTQHKNSEYMITALFSFLNSALNKSPKLRGLQRFMETHDIDVVHFHSVVKEGYYAPFDLNYNKKVYDESRKNGEESILGTPLPESYNDYVDELIEALDNRDITQDEFNKAISKFSFKTGEDVLESLESQYKSGNLEGGINYMIKEFSMDSYMVVQPSPDHIIDAESILGTQMKNIIMADLSDDFSITIKLGGKDQKLSKDEAVKLFNTLLVDNLLDAFSAINSKFNSIDTLHDLLLENMKGNPKYGADVRAALEINEDHTGFTLPFNSPTLSNKIESLILSTFKNEIQRQKISGGQAYLVSNFGISNDLHILYKNGDPSQGIEALEAYLPATYSDMYKDFLVQEGEYYKIDENKMYEALGKSQAEDLMRMIGYRIPTEDKYSIIPIKIKGFLPITAGAAMILPTDFITMSGTDFDIDKLFLMKRSYDRFDYPSTLRDKFLDWAEVQRAKGHAAALNLETEDEVNAAIEENNRKYDKLKSLLKSSKDGYSDNKIEKLVDENEDFGDFMDEIGWDERFNYPKYKIIRPNTTSESGEPLSLSEISRQKGVSKKRAKLIRDNLIIDIVEQTLGDPNVSRLLMQPGNFDRVRHSSRQQKILNNNGALKAFTSIYNSYVKDTTKEGKTPLGFYDYLNSFSTKELDDLYQENADQINPLSIVDYAATQRNLMDGNALIGIFAVNSSNHYKLQFSPLTIDPGYQITINGVTFTQIDPQYSPVNGERVGRINAEFQAASPDNGKDPCLGDMNINADTASRVGFLARIGLAPEAIGILNNCQDFYSYAKSVYQKAKDYGIDTNTLPQTKNFNMDLNKLIQLVAQFRLIKADPEQNIKSLESKENIQFIVMFYKFMQNIDKLSDILNGVMCVSRADSPNGALEVTIPDVIRQIYKTRDYYDQVTQPNCPIKGLDKLVDIELDGIDQELPEEELREKLLEAPIPRLQAAYTLGIKQALSLCGEFFPNLSDTALFGVDYLRQLTRKRLTSKKDATKLRKFIAEMTMAILSINSDFATNEDETIMDKRNYYIHDFPMKFKMMKEKKDKNGNFVYPEFRNLEILSRIDNRSGAGLRFLKVGGTNDRSRKHFTEQLESLLLSDKQEIKELALDLFMYSYFDNGFQFGHSNFGIFFTTTYFKYAGKVLESLNKGNSRLLNNDRNMIINYVHQFLLNNPGIIPSIDGSLFIVNEKGQLVPNGDKAMEAISSGIYKDDEPLMFIVTKQKVWKLEGTGANIYYIECDYNKTGVPFYDLSIDADDIEFSKLKNRGQVGDVSEKTAKKSKEPSISANDVENLSESGEPSGMSEISASYTMLVDPEDSSFETTIPSSDWDNLGDSSEDSGDNEDPEGLEDAYSWMQDDDDNDMQGTATKFKESTDQIDEESGQFKDSSKDDEPTDLRKYSEVADEENKVCHK